MICKTAFFFSGKYAGIKVFPHKEGTITGSQRLIVMKNRVHQSIFLFFYLRISVHPDHLIGSGRFIGGPYQPDGLEIIIAGGFGRTPAQHILQDVVIAIHNTGRFRHQALCLPGILFHGNHLFLSLITYGDTDLKTGIQPDTSPAALYKQQGLWEDLLFQGRAK